MHHHHHHGHCDHSHDHHHHHHDHVIEGNKKGLLIALMITACIMLLEFFGGLFSNSLALLSDSGHMLSDTTSLLLSLIAIWFASRPPSPNKTYGFYRFEILAALFNGVTLVVIAGVIIWEAIERFQHPPTVASIPMMAIAFIGLLSNLLSAWSMVKQADVKNNVNLRSAYLHVIADALGSIGAIIAGAVMYFFGWYAADPLISVVVALLILKGAWEVIKHTIHILMEGTPITIDQVEVERMIKEIDGVVDVHDLHIWTITSGLDSLSCHVLIEDQWDSQDILQKVINKIEEHFKIQHTTIQVEKAHVQHAEMKI